MKKIFYFLFVVIVISCNNASKKETAEYQTKKQIDVELNPNIHTSHIIELFVWPGEYPTRPMVTEAQKYFEPYKNHPAIKLSDSLLQNEIFYFDELTEILLYLEHFPSTKFQYSLDNTPYANRIDIIEEWIEKIAKFYVEASVGLFLENNKYFYEGAKEELIKTLPQKDFVHLIEEYYRDEKIKYTIIPAPEMPTGGAYGYRGIGPYLYTTDGMLIYQVISASLPIDRQSDINKYTKFGFDNKENTLRMSYHEFGHAFVNPLFETNEQLVKTVDKYEHLFTPGFKEVMRKQNYTDWLTVIQEHLVRLGEIRLAERSGNKKWADELRTYHIEQLKFVFLPDLEESIKKYESNHSYASFEDYLPKLLTVLDNFDIEKVEQRLKQ